MILKVLIVATLALLSILDTGNAVKDGRITGGVEPKIQNFPYMASLHVKNIPPIFVCACSIISQRWVVTAASCLFGETYVALRTNTNRYNFEGGVMELVQKIPHLNFNPWTMDNDIALLQTVGDIFFGDRTAAAIDLPGLGVNPPAGQTMMLSGWGASQENGKIEVYLQNTTVKVVDWYTCNEQYAPYGGITKNQFCAAGELGVGGCTSDEGSSLTSQFQLDGVGSFTRGCGDPNFPYVYTRVSAYREWIFQVTGI